uniref:PWWP domain-containing protein n=1 Tax=Gasterosteus aculeatus aculeatus TaxID=481459 RepID=A0AAQ4RN71_GASAC
MSGRSRDQYKQGDLVFAKMKGFPHWPARVRPRKRVLVFFFGTHQMYVLLKNIVPFVGNKMKYGCGVRSKGFSEGMWEIQNTPGVEAASCSDTNVKEQGRTERRGGVITEPRSQEEERQGGREGVITRPRSQEEERQGGREGVITRPRSQE